ncbi:FecCD family ABC transporter permease [Caloramator australicus]|uniref:ABC-type Fe3+-siderophore transport system,permease component n=1 Tax=Caloramator australicus RC3 TaxID=857293 RepID=G0V3R6_9CLOT|nr:iron ABC transporter permease [Caloramator australicus]CCC57756.1 ABC-type Fe3+-siderophore transport system,permease component [Caloramator australicus RC3]
MHFNIRKSFLYINLILILILFFGIILSISLGAKNIRFTEVVNSIFISRGGINSQIIWDIRIPRVLSAALVGAYLSVSGAILQGITRNPLAEPSIIGITQGAIFTIAVFLAMEKNLASLELMLISFLGSSFSGMLVYFISSRRIKKVDPIRLALAGVAIGTLLISLATAIAMIFNLSQQLSFWISGGLSTARWTSLKLLFYLGIVGIVISILISHKITIISLGDEVATSLGVRINLVRLIAIVAVILLSGSSVSVAGNIAFVGLIVPHIVKFLVGTDYKRIIPTSILMGANLLVYSDIVARMINKPYETPIGSLTALIGAPIFIYLIRRGHRGI